MQQLSLDGSWTLVGQDGARYDTTAPTTVLKTLLNHGAIPDPFDGLNEETACARMRETWRFERSFTVKKELLSAPHAELVFEGLDTLAEVELNGKVLGRTDNMHRTWRFPVGDGLQEGKNQLVVTFAPAQTYVEQAALENPDVTDRGGSELLWTGSLRKAHYMFGWDWGPRLPDAGLWRPVYLAFFEHRLLQVKVSQRHEENLVRLTLQTETDASRITAELFDPEGTPVISGEGLPDAPLVLTVSSPRLWWPNGLGDQPLYTLRVRALSGEKTEDEKVLRLGLRTLTVSRRQDAWGESFAFCCNGVEYFAMGADYIPEDNLLTRTTREKTAALLRDCRAAHFNTIRVWGGGIYPGDDFFDLCDELGLVVWQDLMFACNTYKLTPAFRENIRREAEDNVRRFRHHACLGLLCGNNEMEMGMLSWGGVKEQSDSLKQDYLEQNEVLLKGICESEAPDTFYWPSSPSSGGGYDDPNSLDRGDVHDWSVWHGRQPFSDFTRRYPRFCSEFGFESFPCMDTLKTFVHEEREMNPFSQTMESHQKCHSGNATILFYLAQTLRYPFSMEKLVHASQWLQAEAVRAGVEHWRRNRGRCMGAIYWQLNDCWPVASWASIDSLGRWKALQYEAKRFFAPVAVSLAPQEGGYQVFVTNERRRTFRGQALCTVRDVQGRGLRQLSFPVDCPALSAAAFGSVRLREEEEQFILSVVLTGEEGVPVSENQALYTLPKHFPFEKPRIEVCCQNRTVTLKADTFCLGLELQAGDARFSDNWLTLYPGEERRVEVDRIIKEEDLHLLWIE